MKEKLHRGSYTIEAGIYIPMMMFMILLVLRGGIGFYQESKEHQIYNGLESMDVVAEFYQYQMAEEIGKEWVDD